MHSPSYVAPLPFRNGHIQTIFPTFCRRIAGIRYERERIETPDGDFLDLDWSNTGSRNLAIVSHGLEGHTGRPYMRGMVRALNDANVDALAWNYRGCSGEPNRCLRMYHNGSVDDLHLVIMHAIKKGAYDRIHLIGFSLGANLTLLYLGRHRTEVPAAVRGAVAISAPCDLADASLTLERPVNYLYMKSFLRSLHRKIKSKQHRFPQALNDEGYRRIKTFRQFDDRYTAPIHGFADARDYWQKCSSRPWLKDIAVPTLIVNAWDDPFLSGGCFPVAECGGNPLLTLEIPRYGGHVGFVSFRHNGCYWSEHRAVAFIRKIILY